MTKNLLNVQAYMKKIYNFSFKIQFIYEFDKFVKKFIITMIIVKNSSNRCSYNFTNLQISLIRISW